MPVAVQKLAVGVLANRKVTAAAFNELKHKGAPTNKVKAYSDRLAEGNYLVIVDESDRKFDRSQSILKSQGVRDRLFYKAT